MPLEEIWPRQSLERVIVSKAEKRAVAVLVTEAELEPFWIFTRLANTKWFSMTPQGLLNMCIHIGLSLFER
jgi:hypothetical protein